MISQYGFWILILASISSSIKTQASPSSKACESIFNSSNLENSSTHFSLSQDDHLLVSIAELVKKLKRIPSVEEVAWKARRAATDLPDGDQFDVISHVRAAKKRFPQPFLELRTFFSRKIATFFRDHFRFPSLQEMPQVLDLSPDDLDLLWEKNFDYFELARKTHPNHFVSAKKRLIRAYTDLTQKLGRSPDISEFLQKLQLSPEEGTFLFHPQNLYSNLDELKRDAWDPKNKVFQRAIDTKLFDSARDDALIQAIRNRERLIITTAVAGSPVNPVFFNALLQYCNLMDAEIIVFPANMTTTGLDPLLLETPKVHVLTHSVKITPSLTLNRIRILAKQINPLMGLEHLGERGESQVVGSPKMHWKTLPSLDSDHGRHRILTTGALTDPLYAGDKYIQGRTDEIALQDHMMGAIILEKNAGTGRTVENVTFGDFHLRHIEFIPEIEGFLDLNQIFSGSSSRAKKTRPDALVLGDIHVGDTDPKVLDAVRKLIGNLKPKFVIIHDLFNGHSVSKYERDRALALSIKAHAGLLDVEEELKSVTAFLNSLTAIQSNFSVVIVPSNHNDWLSRWLQEGKFMKEPQNTRIGLELAATLNMGGNPLRAGVEKFGLDAPKRIQWLFSGDQFRLGPDHRLVEVGQHGHAGSNGSRGSLKQAKIASGRVVIGHSHTNARLNGAVNIGTSTHLVLGYNQEGASSWIQSVAVVGPYGEIQALELSHGEFFRQAEEYIRPSGVFFPEGYPYLVPNRESPDGVGQIDQYDF